MLSLYEKVEEMGVDTFCMKPQRIRDSYLSRLPSDEITCYFAFMNYNEFILCFSSTVINDCFKIISCDTLFILCQEIPTYYFSKHMSRETFCKKWNMIRPSMMIEGFVHSAAYIFSLVTSQFISYSDIYPALEEYPMSYLSIIYEQHHQCSTLFQPLFKKIRRIFQSRHIADDIVVHCILPFLFYKK